MKIVDPKSLATTLDALSEAFFLGKKLTKAEKIEAAKWIASRQGQPRSYANMFAPTDRDYAVGIRLFTGEWVRSGAATGHILGEEACRALILLNVPDASVRDALNRASLGMQKVLDGHEASGGSLGMYCCGTCTPALWRNLSVGGLKDHGRVLAAGMKVLKQHREGNGRWKRFPFYYTLLALSEIELPSAIKEMQYAAPVLKRILRRSPKPDKFDKRRRILAERVLARC